MNQRYSPPAETEELAATEAAELLGVKLPTLYAYVSRGLLRSLPGQHGRARRYLRSDVVALRDRSRGTRAAEGALRWGEPVLESSITAMTPEGPAYRGHLATRLALEGRSFEAVARLLWTGELAADTPVWPAEDLPDFEALAALLPPDAPHATVAPVVVSAAAATDTARYVTSPEAVLPRAQRLVRLLAASLALPGAPDRAREAFVAPRIAEAPLRAYGLRVTAARVAAVDRLLILMADHELNASTFAARVAASTHADVYSAVTAGLVTLSGPLHGAASDRMEALLKEIRRPEDAESEIHERTRRGERVPGFGHPFYGTGGDPRARLMFETAWELAGRSRAVATLDAVVRAMEQADRPPPNVDVGAVALRAALGMPRGAAAGLFAVGRCAGWVAHILEQYETGHLLRPRARYRGEPLTDG
jgi:citrate synthase